MQSRKQLLSGPLPKKFANPWSILISQEFDTAGVFISCKTQDKRIKLLSAMCFWINTNCQVTGSLSDITIQDEFIYTKMHPSLETMFYSENS